MNWTPIWTFATARFTTELAWAWEEDQDLSWADEDTLDNLKSGKWGNYTFRVRILLDGREVAADYLGNSIYANPEEFRDHIGLAIKSRKDGRNYGSYFTDMIGEAIGATRKALRNAPYIRNTEA